MRYQGLTATADIDTGEIHGESSAFVLIDRSPDTNPAIFVDCSNLPSLTRQEFAAECDINTLMEKYEKTGLLTPQMLSSREPSYLDVSDVPDLQSALALVRDAETAFMTLPARTRLQFENNPLKFVAFAEDPANIDQMREWNLAPPKELPPGPQEVKVVSMPESSSESTSKK